MRAIQRIMFGALAAALLVTAAAAQEPPALKNASPEERARLTPIIEAAKKEGALTYWDVVIQPETNDALSAAFRRHYGLPATFQINYNLAAAASFVTRVEQELAANRVTIDVGAFSVINWLFERAHSGDILEYHSPEHAHYGQIFSAGLGLKGFFAPNGGYVFVPMWSEDHLKFTGKSYKDVAGAVPPGRFGFGDAAKTPVQIAVYTGLRQVLDVGFFRELAKMKPSFIVRSEQTAARLVSGEDLMAFHGMPTRAYQFNQKGAHLKFLFPQEGVVLMPQGTFILKNAPHPNAAKLWIDFILSEQGQTILVKGEALISGRSGFKSPLPDYAPSIDSLKLIPMDWQGMTPQSIQKLRDEWVSIFMP